MNRLTSISGILLLLAVALPGIWPGCGSDPLPPEQEASLYFPEIAEMALVVMNRPTKEGVSGLPASFFIDRYEVTNEAYGSFLQRSGYRPKEGEAFLAHWNHPVLASAEVRAEMNELPVTFVDFDDSLAYARFQGKELPTRDQWLWAAIGGDGSRSFPWGNRFLSFFCNSWRSRIYGPARVGTFENGKSGSGCYDMIGNVAEWSATPVEGAVEPSFHILGGSWSDGGTPDEEAFFDLTPSQSRRPRFAERGSRNSTLGFRCLRNDAIAFIRDELTRRLAELSEEERLSAFDELTPIQQPLDDLLRFLQFESALMNRFPTSPLPALVNTDLSPMEPTALLCYSDGFLGSYNRKGECLWSHQTGEQDAPYQYEVVLKEGGPFGRIVVQSLWASLVEVLDASTGQRICRMTGPGRAQHAQPVGGQASGQGELLVMWATEDRYQHLPVRLKTSEYSVPRFDALFEYLDFYGRCLLHKGPMKTSLRRSMLRYFTGDADQLNLDRAVRFDLVPRGPANLRIREALENRFQIQLWAGGIYSYLEERLAPGSQLVLFDREQGLKKWAFNFPGTFIDYPGILKRRPLLVEEGERIAFLLESDETVAARFCLIDRQTGKLTTFVDLDVAGERVSALASLGRASGMLALIDSEELIRIDPDRGGVSKIPLWSAIERYSRVQGQGLQSLSVATNPGSRKAQENQSVDLQLSDFLAPDSWRVPWLLADSDMTGSSILFMDWQDQGYTMAIDCAGRYNRHAWLSGDGAEVAEDYLLLWGSAGNLLCFNREKANLLWNRSVGEIAEVEPDLIDIDGNGTSEVIIASPGGEIHAIELATGRGILSLKRTGSQFTFLRPFNRESVNPGQRSSPRTLLIGIKNAGIFLLDPQLPEQLESRQNLLLAIRELERWRECQGER